MMTRFLSWCERLANSHKLFRRAVLLWAVVLVTVVVLRATRPEVLTAATAAGATIVTAAIGILTTVIGLYQWMRQRDAERHRANDVDAGR